MPTQRSMIAKGSLAALGIVIVLASGALAAAAPVPAEEYTQTICAEVGSVADETERLGPTFQAAVDTFKATPSQANAIALRQALIDLIGQTAQGVDDLTLTVQNAGTPDVNKGARFARALEVNLRTISAVFHALAAEAADIDVSSATSFANGFDQVTEKINTMQRRFGKQAKRDRALNNKAAALRPLVVFMTTDALRCPA